LIGFASVMLLISFIMSLIGDLNRYPLVSFDLCQVKGKSAP
jgi:hypothetical protein